MFESTKNKLLYIAFSLWALLFFGLSVIKILTLFQQDLSLKTLTTIFSIFEVIALWMLLISVSWTLISKQENIKKLTNWLLLLILVAFIIISLVNLVINNEILKFITQLTLVLVVAAVTINLVSSKNHREELLISLKVAWAVVSILVVIYKESITLHICNLFVTLTMVPLSVYFISLKNVNLKNNDLLSPMLQEI